MGLACRTLGVGCCVDRQQQTQGTPSFAAEASDSVAKREDMLRLPPKERRSEIPWADRTPRAETQPCDAHALETECLVLLADHGKAAELRNILERERVELGLFIVLKDMIQFMAIPHGEEPIARYQFEKKEKGTLTDIAEVLRIHDKASVLIEGHTSTAVELLDSWAHQLAKKRAEKVKSSLVCCGIEPNRVHTVGLPGHHGSRRDDIIIKVFNITDDSLPEASTPLPITQLNRAKLDRIMQRNRLEVGFYLNMKDKISFEPPEYDRDTTARFAHEEKVLVAIQDAAEALLIFDQAEVRIEAHLPAVRLDDYVYEITDNRAELVKETLVSFGVPDHRIFAAGAPGNLGTNRSEVFFKILKIN